MSSEDDEAAQQIAKDVADQIRGERSGAPSVYTCPTCGGVLWQIDCEGEHVCFGCHTGHQFTDDELVMEQKRLLASSLAAALREQKERAYLLRQLAEKARKSRPEGASNLFENRQAERMEADADAADRDAGQIQALIDGLGEP